MVVPTNWPGLILAKTTVFLPRPGLVHSADVVIVKEAPLEAIEKVYIVAGNELEKFYEPACFSHGSQGTRLVHLSQACWGIGRLLGSMSCIPFSSLLGYWEAPLRNILLGPICPDGA